MSTPSANPIYVSLQRLSELSGRTHTTLLLRMRDNDLGGILGQGLRQGDGQSQAIDAGGGRFITFT